MSAIRLPQIQSLSGAGPVPGTSLNNVTDVEKGRGHIGRARGAGKPGLEGRRREANVAAQRGSWRR